MCCHVKMGIEEALDFFEAVAEAAEVLLVAVAPADAEADGDTDAWLNVLFPKNSIMIVVAFRYVPAELSILGSVLGQAWPNPSIAKPVVMFFHVLIITLSLCMDDD